MAPSLFRVKAYKYSIHSFICDRSVIVNNSERKLYGAYTKYCVKESTTYVNNVSIGTKTSS